MLSFILQAKDGVFLQAYLSVSLWFMHTPPLPQNKSVVLLFNNIYVRRIPGGLLRVAALVPDDMLCLMMHGYGCQVNEAQESTI